MTVIAWDGEVLAADRQATNHGLKMTCSKLRKHAGGTILGFCGDLEQGIWLMDWHAAGANPERWPKWQEGEDWTRLVVVTPEAHVFTYEKLPVPVPVLGRFFAWGHGRDFAMGAMAMGASATQAVEVACQFDNTCGMGFEYYRAHDLG